MARVFITGSSDGLGLMAARLPIEQGHEVVLHGRNDGRSRDARAAAAGAKGAVSGDLSTIAGARTVANEVNKLGRFHAVIHNAGIGYRETRRVETEPGVPSVFAVNVLAPYILTALIERPYHWSISAPACTTGCDRVWTICFGPGELGAARRLTRRASFAMFCSHLPSLAAGKTSNLMRWSLDGCRQRWAALQPRTIFSRGL
jgi:NAD(P)-dependent dehydrogenase (short-subunit alcohol dehydrogenase family)